MKQKEELRKSDQTACTMSTSYTEFHRGSVESQSQAQAQSLVRTPPVVTRLYLDDVSREEENCGDDDTNNYNNFSSSKKSFRVVSSRDGNQLRLTPVTNRSQRGLSVAHSLFPVITSDE